MSEEKNKDEAKKIITSENRDPCGCITTIYSDKTGIISPCLACGLMDAARSFQKGVDALKATAIRLQADKMKRAEALQTIQVVK